MAFTGQENHSITLQDACDLTRNYRNTSPNSIKGHFFGRETIERILAQESCVGIRIYHGLDNNGKQELILVGVEPNENDLENGVIAEQAPPCPPYCGQTNALNS